MSTTYCLKVHVPHELLSELKADGYRLYVGKPHNPEHVQAGDLWNAIASVGIGSHHHNHNHNHIDLHFTLPETKYWMSYSTDPKLNSIVHKRVPVKPGGVWEVPTGSDAGEPLKEVSSPHWVPDGIGFKNSVRALPYLYKTQHAESPIQPVGLRLWTSGHGILKPVPEPVVLYAWFALQSGAKPHISYEDYSKTKLLSIGKDTEIEETYTGVGHTGWEA